MPRDPPVTIATRVPLPAAFVMVGFVAVGFVMVHLRGISVNDVMLALEITSITSVCYHRYMTLVDAEPSTRDRIAAAAAALLEGGGRDAVSTRAVSAGAGVQAPAIYRLFGDKQGLLDAVAGHGFARYLAAKAAAVPSGDPVEDLRRGWDMHVEFGVAHPAVYTLIYGDARPGQASPAARDAAAILRALVDRIAAAGRLRVPVERAVAMVHAAGCGVTLSLIATPLDDRDPHMSAQVRDAVLAAVATAPAGPDRGDAHAAPVDRSHDAPGRHAIALAAALPDRDPRFSPAERALLGEWLHRLQP
jgi:AcrR family transcriptional regulator